MYAIVLNIPKRCDYDGAQDVIRVKAKMSLSRSVAQDTCILYVIRSLKGAP